MKALITYKNKDYKIDLTKPLKIAIPIGTNKQNINAWYIGCPKIKPEAFGNQQMTVKDGASVNFNGISFNPHSHITHTECIGHITKKIYSVYENLNTFFFLTKVITIKPENHNKDAIITRKQLERLLKEKKYQAVVIRTLPNTKDKTTKQYSNTNPPYIEESAAIFLREIGIEHLLIDLPSIDKEKDNGKLLAHNAFWNTNNTIRYNATITEFIYVPNTIKDGDYFINLMIAPFENDATPSTPTLYKIIKNNE